MSFTAALNIGGKEFELLHVDYDFIQPTNAQRQPVSKPVSGFINLTIEASKDSEPIEWMLNASMVKNGEVIFYEIDSHSIMRKIEFENAYCVYYREVFDNYNNKPMLIYLKLSPQKMTVAGQSIAVGWTIGGESKSGGGESGASSSGASSPGSGGVSSFIAD
ncbi:type VI secretion system tube protein TssD [Niabella insulamsoli]|uniref:type VI secretion system tube protein TssD n=1 Tax=Niabella insulamsoli TaxID=3144874 RepID=UPI0031FBFA09